MTRAASWRTSSLGCSGSNCTDVIQYHGVPLPTFHVQSRSNRHYKLWQQYVLHPESPDCPWIAVEGWKQAQDLSVEHRIQLLLYSLPEDPRLEALRARSRNSLCLPPALLRRLSTLSTPASFLAFFEKPSWSWSDLTPCVLYLDRIQDPGNLGALLRSARATGLFSLVTSPATVSCFNSKAVRASASALFSVPLLAGVPAEELKGRGYFLWGAHSREGVSLFQVDFVPPLAVLIGSEGEGLAESVTQQVDAQLHIPTHPAVDSLNAAVAGSLIVFEVFRQKGGHGHASLP